MSAEDEMRPCRLARPLADYISGAIYSHVLQACRPERRGIGLGAHCFLEWRRRNLAETRLIANGRRLTCPNGIKRGSDRRRIAKTRDFERRGNAIHDGARRALSRPCGIKPRDGNQQRRNCQDTWRRSSSLVTTCAGDRRSHRAETITALQAFETGSNRSYSFTGCGLMAATAATECPQDRSHSRVATFFSVRRNRKQESSSTVQALLHRRASGEGRAMSLVRLLGFRTLTCGCVIGRYRELATSREVTYIEEKGSGCQSHGHRRNHTVVERASAPAATPITRAS
jgi:hypothetical protein